MDLNGRFQVITQEITALAGTWQASVCAVAIVAIWILSGFYFGFHNEVYHLTISSITTCVTFIMVFVIENTQNRDTKAIQLKLDELVRATAGARDELASAEDLDERKLDQIKHQGLPP